MTYSKIISGDLPELINEIIQYFRNDFPTLYSCILVNRLWCRIAIPLLWENPFSIPTKNYHFIKIYLHNINEHDKAKLNGYGIINDDIFPSNTLFNYPSFIKYLNTWKIYRSIITWTSLITTARTYYYSLSLSFISKTLFKIFIENKANLHTFEVIASMYFDYLNGAFELILQNPNFIRGIKNLKLQITYSSNFDSLLSFLSLNCNSISTFYVQFDRLNSLNETFSSHIINSQQNLKTILFKYNHFPLHHSLLSLKNSNCSNTLKTIIFCRINFKNIIILNEVIEHLNVLESIHLLYCHSLNSDFIQQIINTTKQFKLKSLFMDVMLQIDSLRLLLRKSGDYLENIGLVRNEFEKPLLELIISYCVKIKYLELQGYNQSIHLAFDLIKNIGQNLNYLTIDFDNSILLQGLGQILPSKLEYLNLNLMIIANDFEIFLKNFQNTFVKKLLINNKMGQDISPYIEDNIIKRQRVKYLAFKDHDTDLFFLDDQVDKFKIYNVIIQCYEDLKIDGEKYVEEMGEIY